MSFMEPFVEFGHWYEVGGPQGIEFVPQDLCGTIDLASGPFGEDSTETGLKRIPEPLAQYCQDRKAWTIREREGWGARMSAPGYLDCTEWSVFDSREDAEQYLAEYEECETECEE